MVQIGFVRKLLPLDVLKIFSPLLLLLVMLCSHTYADSYVFGVLAQKSAVSTANTWNPILSYVESKTKIKLVLKTTRTGEESKRAIDNGEYDFVYSNQIFDRQNQIYIPILRPNTPDITGQIVTLDYSGINSISDLLNRPIGFPSKAAFVAYAVTTGYLKKQNIEYKEVFGGNQEGIIAQLKSGAVKAASVNGAIMKNYALREGMTYKILWESEKFIDIPIAVHTRISKDIAAKVQSAIANMAKDPDGKKVLDNIGNATKQKPFPGFSKADLQTYHGYVDFYKKSRE